MPNTCKRSAVGGMQAEGEKQAQLETNSSSPREAGDKKMQAAQWTT